MAVRCSICGRTGEPDSPEELERLREEGRESWEQGQWAFVEVRGVAELEAQRVLVCSVTCAVQAAIQQAQKVRVRDVRRGGAS